MMLSPLALNSVAIFNSRCSQILNALFSVVINPIKWLMLCLLLLLFMAPLGVQAETKNDSGEMVKFDSLEQEKIYKELVFELRCLVCQNQNLADSNAELAIQLRGKVYEMLQQGKTKEEIQDYMVQRYGDFVLYNPPVKSHTLLLWLGPFILLILGFVFLFFIVKSAKKQKAVHNNTQDDAARQEVKQLLSGDDRPGHHKD